MASASSIAKRRPLLQGIFGPISNKQDRAIGAVLREVDEALADMALRLGGHSQGPDGDGLNLVWLPSGKLHIGGGVSTANVFFGVSLSPSWGYEEASENASWIVEAEIEADCLHSHDHGGTHVVWERPSVRGATPEAAVTALLEATHELATLAFEQPLAVWSDRAKD